MLERCISAPDEPHTCSNSEVCNILQPSNSLKQLIMIDVLIMFDVLMYIDAMNRCMITSIEHLINVNYLQQQFAFAVTCVMIYNT